MQLRIKGTVQAYSSDVNAGTILGEDNQTYYFSRKDWMFETDPQVKTKVVFLSEGATARSITLDL